MKKYKVHIKCENYLIDLDDQLTQMGFNTTRYIEASDERNACIEAVDSLKKEEKFMRGMRNLENDSPRFVVEDLEVMESFEGIENLRPGFAFFEEEIDTEN